MSNFDKDLLSTELFSHGCVGIEEYSGDNWRIYFSQALSERQRQLLLEKLKKLNPSLDLKQTIFSVQPQQDWNTEWKKHFRPLKVTGRIWVAPPWKLPRIKKEEILLTIDPQMAFGTGSHESTQLMIRAMEKYLPPNQRVLDAGTGSGILAILAKKLGAAKVFAFDIEQEAIDNARHNALINRAGEIDFHCGDFTVVPAGEFDVVLANINRTILLEMMPSFRKTLRQNGLFILSGILTSDEAALQQAMTGWLMYLEKFEEKEWISLVLKKEG